MALINLSEISGVCYKFFAELLQKISTIKKLFKFRKTLTNMLFCYYIFYSEDQERITRVSC